MSNIKEYLRNSPIAPEIAERAAFINFVLKFPEAYRKYHETSQCLSVGRDYHPLHALSLPEKRQNLGRANARVSRKFQHAFAKTTCPSCLRLMNLHTLFQSQRAGELLTPEAKAFIDLEYGQRVNESSAFRKNFVGDGLYLIQLASPLSCSLEQSNYKHKNHLIFYSSSHVRRGQQVLEDRVKKNHSLAEIINKFNPIHPCQFAGVSQYHTKARHTGSQGSETIIEIVARSNYS